MIHQFDMGTCEPIGDEFAGHPTETIRDRSDPIALRLLSVAESEAAARPRRFPAAVVMSMPEPLAAADD